MRYGSANPNSTEEAEYSFQEVRAERMRATLLFHGYAVDEDNRQDGDEHPEGAL